MNRREKAIWNIVIFISIILVGFFTYLISLNFKISNKNIDDFKISLQNAGKYSLPIYTNNILIALIKEYNLDVQDIIKQSKEKEGTQVTESNVNNFMENKEVFKKGTKPYSSIHGFSLKNEKITPGEYLLTEIPGNIFSNKKY